MKHRLMLGHFDEIYINNEKNIYKYNKNKMILLHKNID